MFEELGEAATELLAPRQPRRVADQGVVLGELSGPVAGQSLR
jgi:hypothetical protein